MFYSLYKHFLHRIRIERHDLAGDEVCPWLLGKQLDVPFRVVQGELDERVVLSQVWPLEVVFGFVDYCCDCTGWSNCILLRKLKYFICSLRDLLLFYYDISLTAYRKLEFPV